MTNKGARAILGLPQMPERQLRFLLALETFTRREDGWRPSGTELLADAAGLSPRTVAKARSELVAAGLIDYRRGDGRGHVSTYQIRAPGVADHHLKVATEVATFKGGNDVATFTQAERWQPEPVKVADQADKGSRRNALTSRNSFGAPKDSALKESALPRPVLAGSGGPAVNSPEEGSRGQIIDDQETGDNSKSPRPASQARNESPHTRLGICPECEQPVAVTGNGKIGRHTATERRNPGTRYRCPAEGRTPLTMVTP